MATVTWFYAKIKVSAANYYYLAKNSGIPFNKTQNSCIIFLV
jgi:hypothetical protein